MQRALTDSITLTMSYVGIAGTNFLITDGTVTGVDIGLISSIRSTCVARCAA